MGRWLTSRPLRTGLSATKRGVRVQLVFGCPSQSTLSLRVRMGRLMESLGDAAVIILPTDLNKPFSSRPSKIFVQIVKPRLGNVSTACQRHVTETNEAKQAKSLPGDALLRSVQTHPEGQVWPKS